MTAPIGYFVHHQGRGHAERCAALVNAMSRPVTIFCARDDIFPPLRSGVRVLRIPSLFEPTGAEIYGLDHIPTPQTLHCAPLGWPGIRTAMGAIAGWFAEAAPALIVTDVSVEIAQLARICSIPHVAVLQHGDRSDPGHRAAYEGAAGILAPFHQALAQPDWNWMRGRMFFAPGLGCPGEVPAPSHGGGVLVISGGGGDGFSAAPLGVGARAFPDMRWTTLGHVKRDWHATEPSNLTHLGWVDNVADHIAGADLIVASTGNTTCHQVLAAGKPWIAVPEWRYFDEQVFKARALHAAGAAWHSPALPSSAHAWRQTVEAARRTHDPDRQRSLAGTDGAARAAEWLETLAIRLSPPMQPDNIIPIPATS
ncbi:glycosyltransferase [Falsirhodobacter xinxiangensis]|uniref:glycosyltransferase n=1 Tax=Falsirhodobacter xinxiangensis TaxID=2530049 RepID=UPI0010AAEB9B|nr:glycosyltransferase [Rhodobacter xinxiangensis]